MKSLTRFVPLLALLAAALPSYAVGRLGDPAGPLAIKEFIKGAPVSLAEGKGKQVYVVEFWATWCGPCKVSIPHLTEMQSKFKDKGVTFIGISDEDSETVRPFVDKMGAKMDYTVAVDTDRRTYGRYMTPYHRDGIPSAFVVDKEGRIAWTGHPMDGLEDVLTKVVDGTYDLAAAQKAYEEEGAKAAHETRLNEIFTKYITQYEAGQPAADATAEELLKEAGDDARILTSISYVILANPKIKHRDLKFALRASNAAVKLSGGKDASILSINARALADNDKLPDAILQQKRAIDVATPAAKPELEKILKTLEDKQKAETK